MDRDLGVLSQRLAEFPLQLRALGFSRRDLSSCLDFDICFWPSPFTLKCSVSSSSTSHTKVEITPILPKLVADWLASDIWWGGRDTPVVCQLELANCQVWR